MINIERIWSTYPLERVLKRPRVSIKVDQYIWDYIYKNVALPKKILQSEKWIYCLVIAMRKYEPGLKYSKNDEENLKYDDFMRRMGDTGRIFGIENFYARGKNKKSSQIEIVSPLITNKITPEQYADLVFDGFSAFLTDHFKKIKKTEIDSIKSGLSKDIINSYPFPAPFEEQEYLGDKALVNLEYYYKKQIEQGEKL